MLHESTVSLLVDLWMGRAERAQGPVAAVWDTAAIELRHAVDQARAEAEMHLTTAAQQMGFSNPERGCARCPEAVDTPNGTLCADCRSRVMRAAQQKRRRAARQPHLVRAIR